MQISRPTLREAIRVLADAGVVEVKAGAAGGMYVASDYVPRDVLHSKSEVRIGEIAGVLEARRILEPRVAQVAAMRATAEDFEEMQRIIDETRALIGSGEVLREEDRFLQLDVRFHIAMARATRNQMIVTLVRELFRGLEIARDMAMHVPPVPGWVLDVHERTLAAIASGDLGRIDAVMDEHLRKMEDTWQEETGQALIRPVPQFLRSAGNVPKRR
jgi:DNA-binding FadR family transcriptional regulator